MSFFTPKSPIQALLPNFQPGSPALKVLLSNSRANLVGKNPIISLQLGGNIMLPDTKIREFSTSCSLFNDVLSSFLASAAPDASQHKRRNILEMNLASNPELGWGVDKNSINPIQSTCGKHPLALAALGSQEQLFGQNHYKRMGEPNLSPVGVSSVIHHFLPGSSVQLSSGANQRNTKIDVCISKSRRQMDLLSSKLSLSLEKQERKCTKDL